MMTLRHTGERAALGHPKLVMTACECPVFLLPTESELAPQRSSQKVERDSAQGENQGRPQTGHQLDSRKA